jgi:hypothetical protein
MSRGLDQFHRQVAKEPFGANQIPACEHDLMAAFQQEFDELQVRGQMPEPRAALPGE